MGFIDRLRTSCGGRLFGRDAFQRIVTTFDMNHEICFIAENTARIEKGGITSQKYK